MCRDNYSISATINAIDDVIAEKETLDIIADVIFPSTHVLRTTWDTAPDAGDRPPGENDDPSAEEDLDMDVTHRINCSKDASSNNNANHSSTKEFING